MADEPTARAQWNVRVSLAFIVVLFAVGLTIWGLAAGMLDWKEATAPWIAAGIVKANDLLSGK